MRQQRSIATYGVHTSLSHERKISHSEIHSEGKVVFRNGAFLSSTVDIVIGPIFFKFPFKLAPIHSLVGTGQSRFQNPIGSLPSTLVYF